MVRMRNSFKFLTFYLYYFSENFTRDLDRSIALFQLSDDYTALRDSYFSSAPFPTPEIGILNKKINNHTK
jgi:hypothetical protein